jgi:hypothetical protein
VVNYVLAGAARTQAAAMIQELEAARPGAIERLAQGALAELRTWPELTVLEVDENLTEQGCSVAGAYDFGPPPHLSVATSASRARRDFTALHELGHHLQKNSFALMEPFGREPDGGLLLEDAACDAFAAEILLPAPLVNQHLDTKGPTASTSPSCGRRATPPAWRSAFEPPSIFLPPDTSSSSTPQDTSPSPHPTAFRPCDAAASRAT